MEERKGWRCLWVLWMVVVAGGCASEEKGSATRPAFEREIEAFEAADRVARPPRDAVLFVGSSSIRMWKSLAEDFPDHVVINRAFGGSTIGDCVRYADRIVIPYRPKRIVLYAGDNDIAKGMTPERVAADFREFVEKVRKGLPEVAIDYISIKPSLARWGLVEKMRQANGLTEAYAKETKGVGYIDVFGPMLGEEGKPRRELFVADGLHLSRKGYELWGGIMRGRIR